MTPRFTANSFVCIHPMTLAELKKECIKFDVDFKKIHQLCDKKLKIIEGEKCPVCGIHYSIYMDGSRVPLQAPENMLVPYTIILFDDDLFEV